MGARLMAFAKKAPAAETASAEPDFAVFSPAAGGRSGRKCLAGGARFAGGARNASPRRSADLRRYDGRHGSDPPPLMRSALLSGSGQSQAWIAPERAGKRRA